MSSPEVFRRWPDLPLRDGGCTHGTDSCIGANQRSPLPERLFLQLILQVTDYLGPVVFFLAVWDSSLLSSLLSVINSQRHSGKAFHSKVSCWSSTSEIFFRDFFGHVPPPFSLSSSPRTPWINPGTLEMTHYCIHPFCHSFSLLLCTPGELEYNLALSSCLLIPVNCTHYTMQYL